MPIKPKQERADFRLRINRRAKYLVEAARDALAVVADNHTDILLKALSGPNYGKTGSKWSRGPLTNAGVLPIPQRTERLRKSLRLFRLSDDHYRFISDKTNMKYGPAIHFGTLYIKHRPWFYWTMRDKKPEYVKKIRDAMANAKSDRKARRSK